MDRRIAWVIGTSFACVAFANAQPPAGTGYYPAAPGPVMALPSNVLFPEPTMPQMPGAGMGEPPPRFPVDENGNRAINWFYSQTDIMFGWTRDAGGRALGSSGDSFGRGVLGEANTSSFGPGNEFDSAFGVRTTAGYWITPARKVAFEASGFVFERQTAGFSASSNADGLPVLARPFLDATTNAENARNIAYPGAFTGRMDVLSSMRVYGADAGWVFNTIERDNLSVDFTAGFKFVSLIENLNSSDFTQALPNGLLVFNGNVLNAPAAIGTNDHVSTQNRFYGAALGLRLSGDFERLTYSLGGKVGLGWMRQSQTTSGITTLYADGITPTQTAAGGMYVLPSNTGRYVRTQFAAVPELSLRLGYHLTNRVGVYIGYDLLYLSNAVRPSDALNQPINPSLLPTTQNFGVPFGPTSPTGGINSSNFLLQAITGGFSVVF